MMKKGEKVHIRKKASDYCSLLIIFCLFILNLSSPSIPPQEKVQEEVTVTAVEVPVRVIKNGRILKNLAREDFEIYENGIKQEITAFEVVSRKISLPRGEKTRPKKRLFMLIFNIFDYNDSVGEGIDYFFENFFHPGDQLIILTENRLLNIEIGKSLSKLIQNLKETLKKYKIISTGKTLKAYQDLRYEADRLLRVLRAEGYSESNWDQATIRFYENYRRIWNDYKKQYITPDTFLYKSIIKRIKRMEGEKWALCFHQRELFPKLRNEGPLEFEIKQKVDNPTSDPMRAAMVRTIRSKQMEFKSIFDVSNNFPIETLKNLFMEANITFHLILLKSPRTLVSKDFELKEVAQDYEDCFKQISYSTGGYSTFSNKVSEALKEATETEDYHYLLVYSPKDSQSKKKRNIDVKVKKSGVEIICLKDIPRIEAPPIAISNFKSGKKTISFSLINYKRVRVKEGLAGYADVKITIFDENSEKVFDEVKTLSLIKKDTHISLRLDMLKSGYHFIIIQAIDRVSNEIDVLSANIKL